MNSFSLHAQASRCRPTTVFALAPLAFSAVYVGATGTVTTECLVGCGMLDISPFDEGGYAVWDNRSACDDSLGCDVDNNNIPSSGYSILWAETSGTDGSSSCSCKTCNPWDYSSDSYMAEYPLWTRILCYIAAAETKGYDMSPCVAAVVDYRAMACVSEPFETPSIGQFDCEPSSLPVGLETDSYCLPDQSSITREASEMFSESPAPFSPTPSSTPVAETTLNPTVDAATTFPILSELSSSTTDTAPADDFVGAPTPLESHMSSSTSSPVALNAPANFVTIVAATPAPGASRQPATSSPAGHSYERSTVPPTAVASSESPAPISVVADISCAAGSVCSGNLCCHPDSKTCGRKYTFCQERDTFNGLQCCTGTDGYLSELNVCSEDIICDVPEESETNVIETVELWVGITGGILGISTVVAGCVCYIRRRKSKRDGDERADAA